MARESCSLLMSHKRTRSGSYHPSVFSKTGCIVMLHEESRKNSVRWLQRGLAKDGCTRFYADILAGSAVGGKRPSIFFSFECLLRSSRRAMWHCGLHEFVCTTVFFPLDASYGLHDQKIYRGSQAVL